MIGIDDRLILLANHAIDLTRVDFGVPETGGFRTKEDQALLYRQNKSNCDGVSKLSNHQKGRALDFYAYADGKASWQKEHLSQVAAAFLQAAIELKINIRWGGLFRSFADFPHIELVD
jgi:uncharacterized protein YcbK (DUF882 family)